MKTVLLILAFSVSSVAQSVQMQWTGSAGALGYRVYRSSASDMFNPSKLGDVMVTSFTDTGCAVGTTCYYAVTAYNAEAESGYSNVIRYDVPASGVLPKPTGLTSACSSDGTSVNISWNPVVGATAYYLRFHDANGQERDYDLYIPTSKTESITPGLAYDWWVHGFSPTAGTFNPNWGPGIGDYSLASFTCNPSVAQPPPPPTNLQIVFIQPTMTQLSRGVNTIQIQGSTGTVRTQLFIDGSLKATNPQNSLTYSWYSNKKGSHTLKGIPFDLNSQAGTPSTMTVTLK